MRVLVFGDTHIPFMRKGYMDFLVAKYQEFKCDTVVMIGDLIDLHRISRHTKDPSSDSAASEYESALKQLPIVYKAFPKVKAIYGNHEERYYTQTGEKEVPPIMLKTIAELTKSPKGWEWANEWTIDNVRYFHGTVYQGPQGHMTALKNSMKSVVMGHLHTNGGVQYLATPDELVFAMATGCGMDSNSYAAAYAKNLDKKPIVGCGVVIDGLQAIFLPMNLGSRVKRLIK